MIRRTFLTISLLTITTASAVWAQEPPKMLRKPTIAVMGVAESGQMMQTPGGILEGMMENALTASGTVTVVRRQDLPEQFKEIKLSEQGLVSEEARKALGKLKVADYLLSLSPSRGNLERRTRKVITGYTSSGKEKTKTVSYYQVDLGFIFRFTNVETGTVITAPTEVSLEDDQRSDGMDRALKVCFAQLTLGLAKASKSTRQETASFTVALVRDDYIRVAFGSDQGLTKDSELQIVEEVKDGQFTDLKVICDAKPFEVNADNAKLELGTWGKGGFLGSSRKWRRDNKLIQKVKVGQTIKFAAGKSDKNPANPIDIFSSLK